MPSSRYTIVIADRQTGVVRRFTIGLKPALYAVGFLFSIPVLIGMGAAWKTRADVADLYAAQASLELENANFRGATEALTDQIMALQSTISDLGANAALDPSLQSSMDQLPAIVKSRAMGGPNTGATLATAPLGLSSPETTFGLLKDLLSGLESRLQLVRSDVAHRNQLAAATPSIWPAQGWLSSGAGKRSDPFTGEQDTHEGLDISADRGSPVFATANGTVSTASSAGAYGNLIVVDHGYGLETRYGHLQAFRVKAGDEVQRGQQIGIVGSTGRATGPHLHYEVRVNGRILNPLNLLTNRRRSAAN